MVRLKLVYWALIAVLVSLALFLLAAGVRALLGRRAGGGGEAGGGDAGGGEGGGAGGADGGGGA